LRRAAEVLDFGQSAAVLLPGVLHLIQDSDDPRGIVARLMERGPEPGVRCGCDPERCQTGRALLRWAITGKLPVIGYVTVPDTACGVPELVQSI
jgi:S-adenosyl methyltransferase